MYIQDLWSRALIVRPRNLTKHLKLRFNLLNWANQRNLNSYTYLSRWQNARTHEEKPKVKFLWNFTSSCCIRGMLTLYSMKTCYWQVFMSSWIHATDKSSCLHGYMQLTILHVFMDTIATDKSSCLHGYMQLTSLHVFMDTCNWQVFMSSWIHATDKSSCLHRYMQQTSLHGYMQLASLHE